MKFVHVASPLKIEILANAVDRVILVVADGAKREILLGVTIRDFGALHLYQEHRQPHGTLKLFHC